MQFFISSPLAVLLAVLFLCISQRVTANEAGGFTVTSPAAGWVLKPGGTVNIAWRFTESRTVSRQHIKIGYGDYNVAGPHVKIFTLDDRHDLSISGSSGSFQWKPSNADFDKLPNNDQYYIRVYQEYSDGNAPVDMYTPRFVVNKSTPPPATPIKTTTASTPPKQTTPSKPPPVENQPPASNPPPQNDPPRDIPPPQDDDRDNDNSNDRPSEGDSDGVNKEEGSSGGSGGNRNGSGSNTDNKDSSSRDRDESNTPDSDTDEGSKPRPTKSDTSKDEQQVGIRTSAANGRPYQTLGSDDELEDSSIGDLYFGDRKEGSNESSATEREFGNNDSGLSNGVKIGIGVGVSLFIVILLMIIGMILLRRRRQQKERPDSWKSSSDLLERKGQDSERNSVTLSIPDATPDQPSACMEVSQMLLFKTLKGDSAEQREYADRFYIPSVHIPELPAYAKTVSPTSPTRSVSRQSSMPRPPSQAVEAPIDNISPRTSLKAELHGSPTAAELDASSLATPQHAVNHSKAKITGFQDEEAIPEGVEMVSVESPARVLTFNTFGVPLASGGLQETPKSSEFPPPPSSPQPFYAGATASSSRRRSISSGTINSVVSPLSDSAAPGAAIGSGMISFAGFGSPARRPSASQVAPIGEVLKIDIDDDVTSEVEWLEEEQRRIAERKMLLDQEEAVKKRLAELRNKRGSGGTLR